MVPIKKSISITLIDSDKSAKKDDFYYIYIQAEYY
jgi:hypothetical protein